jgi:hypothetical protein
MEEIKNGDVTTDGVAGCALACLGICFIDTASPVLDVIGLTAGAAASDEEW